MLMTPARIHTHTLIRDMAWPTHNRIKHSHKHILHVAYQHTHRQTFFLIFLLSLSQSSRSFKKRGADLPITYTSFPIFLVAHIVISSLSSTFLSLSLSFSFIFSHLPLVQQTYTHTFIIWSAYTCYYYSYIYSTKFIRCFTVVEIMITRYYDWCRWKHQETKDTVL